MNSIIMLQPIFKHVLWGGSKLRTDFGYDIEGNDLGECWGISAHPNGDCYVLNDEFKGYTLSKLWNEKRELFGGFQSEKFPLLIKIIDAKADLSVQVHPDDEYAKANENGSYGKTECWYILDCEPDSKIVIGHNAKSKEEVVKMIDGHLWKEFIREIPIKKGDFFQIEPGCLHAIKGGTVILETQQNSDITYRVYDYDRLSNGKPRELHVEKSKDVIKAPFVPNSDEKQVIKGCGFVETKLITCKFYKVALIDISESYEIEKVDYFYNVTVIEGNGQIATSNKAINIKKGDNFIISCSNEKFTFTGNIKIIISTIC